MGDSDESKAVVLVTAVAGVVAGVGGLITSLLTSHRVEENSKTIENHSAQILMNSNKLADHDERITVISDSMSKLCDSINTVVTNVSSLNKKQAEFENFKEDVHIEFKTMRENVNDLADRVNKSLAISESAYKMAGMNGHKSKSKSKSKSSNHKKGNSNNW